jgi:DNA-binding transcriptional LysR family regulator
LQNFAAELIAAFLRQHAGIDLQLVEGHRAVTVESLRNYDTDMALMGRPPGDFGAESEPFGPHPYVMIAPADHRLARAKRVSKAELSSQKFIVREEGSGTRNIFEYFLSAQMIQPPKVTIEMGSNETIKQAVMAGLGLSLIWAHTIASEVVAGRLAVLKVAGLPIVRQWFVVRRTDRDLPPASGALWTFFVKKAAPSCQSACLPGRAPKYSCPI